MDNPRKQQPDEVTHTQRDKTRDKSAIFSHKFVLFCVCEVRERKIITRIMAPLQMWLRLLYGPLERRKSAEQGVLCDGKATTTTLGYF